jgi:hypothetical protein
LFISHITGVGSSFMTHLSHSYSVLYGFVDTAILPNRNIQMAS